MNQARYDRFRKELNSLQDSVGFDQKYRSIKAKIYDYLAKNDVRGMADDDLIREFKKLFDPDFEKHIDDIFKKYADTVDLVNDMYDDIGDAIPDDFGRLLATEETNKLQLGKYEQSTLEAIAKKTRDTIKDGGGIKELRAAISEIDDRAKAYADTLAKTQIKTHGRIAKAEKAAIAEIQVYQYVGIQTLNTRPFCTALLNSNHHIKNINLMNNGNKESVLHTCGGWNCKHDWEPNPDATSYVEGSLQQFGSVLIYADAAILAKYSAASLLQ